MPDAFAQLEDQDIDSRVVLDYTSRPEVFGEGHAAARTMGCGDEAEARPAGNTERTGLGDDFVTAEAKRRQDRIEQPPPRRCTPFPQHHRPIEPGKYVGKRAIPYPGPRFRPT